MIWNAILGAPAGRKERDLLMVVLTWELRRLLGARRGWWLAGGTFGGALLLVWLMAGALNLGDRLAAGPVNSWGAFWLLSAGLLLLRLVFTLVSTGLVARDLDLRVHELLMATAVPTWVYVLGRWLAGLITCLIPTLALPLGLLVGGETVHLLDPAHTLPPAVGALALAWLLMAPVDLLLVTGASFALGTAVPAMVRLLPGMLVVFWLLVVEQGPAVANWLAAYLFHAGPVPFDRFIPAHAPVVSAIFDQYVARYDAVQTTNQSLKALSTLVLAPLPDISSWLGHLAYCVVGLLLVLLTCRRFRRFQGY